MKDIDSVIIFVNNKKNIVENIIYKYCILKKYDKQLCTNILNKFISKINNKQYEICDFAIKLRKKLILDKDEERLLEIIIKFFKYNNVTKIIKNKKKVIKKTYSEPTISESENSKTNTIIDSYESDNNVNSDANSDSSSSQSCKKKNYTNNNIFITKNDLVNTFGNKVCHDKKPKKTKKNKKSSNDIKKNNLNNSKNLNNNCKETSSLCYNSDKNYNVDKDNFDNLENNENIKIITKNIIRM